MPSSAPAQSATRRPFALSASWTHTCSAASSATARSRSATTLARLPPPPPPARRTPRSAFDAPRWGHVAPQPREALGSATRRGACPRVRLGGVAPLFANTTIANRKAIAYVGSQPVQLMGLVETRLSAVKAPRVAKQLRALGFKSWLVGPLPAVGRGMGVPLGGILVVARDDLRVHPPLVHQDRRRRAGRVVTVLARVNRRRELAGARRQWRSARQRRRVGSR